PGAERPVRVRPGAAEVGRRHDERASINGPRAAGPAHRPPELCACVALHECVILSNSRTDERANVIVRDGPNTTPARNKYVAAGAQLTRASRTAFVELLLFFSSATTSF